MLYREHELTFFDSDNFETTKTKRFLALEPEIDGFELPYDKFEKNITKLMDKWKVDCVSDGSLNGCRSFELKTQPAQGSEFVMQIEDVSTFLTENNCRVDEACGMHTHIDARDFKFWQMLNLIRVYAHVEDCLFKIVDRTRQNNTFCKRIGDRLIHKIESYPFQHHYKDMFCDALYSGVYKKRDLKDRLKSTKDATGRYWSFNFHSWVYRGTIECRLHQGTTKKSDMLNWPLLLSGILDYAYLFRKTYQLPSDPWETLMIMAPTDEVRNWAETSKRTNSN